MANEEHLVILKKGVEAWNQWRERNPEIIPSLAEANLRGEDLRGANLCDAYLRGADLSLADLKGANLSEANLRQAHLSGADLGPKVIFRADLSQADLTGADLSLANLSGAHLTDANLREANLSGANLGSADLGGANFIGTELTGADISGARLYQTTFVDADLSQIKGLETMRHEAPSAIGIDTIYKSRGRIPQVFLRGAGVPEPFIVQMNALVAAMEPIQFYSCFISYSTKDQEFAERLYADLQQKNVRCWFAPEDIKIGDKFRQRIDEAIRVHDKLLLVLTENSVKSKWVEKEVETAFEKERKHGRTVLFPIRLDDAVMEAEEAWAADIRRTRHIGDFSEWKDHDKYKKAFEGLMRDLRAEEGHR